MPLLDVGNCGIRTVDVVTDCASCTAEYVFRPLITVTTENRTYLQGDHKTCQKMKAIDTRA
jgi:hypothetical protein